MGTNCVHPRGSWDFPMAFDTKICVIDSSSCQTWVPLTYFHKKAIRTIECKYRWELDKKFAGKTWHTHPNLGGT